MIYGGGCFILTDDLPSKGGYDLTPVKRKKKSAAWIVLFILLLLVGLSALGYMGYSRYTMYDGKVVARDTQELDLRGRETTPEEIAAAQETLPNAHILYDVTIAGKTYSCDEKEIVTGDVSMEEIPLFSRFEALVFVDASACSDLKVIYALREALTPAEVVWTVPLAGQSIPGEETALTLERADAGELAAALRRLPKVETVTVKEACFTADEQAALGEEFDRISFIWPVQIPGGSVETDTRELSFAGKNLTETDLAALDKALAFLPKVEKIDLTGTPLPEEALLDFAARHEGVLCLFSLERFGVEFTTADEVITFDDIPLTVADAESIEALLPAMPNLKKVEMLRCGISNEDMETINLRHDDVQFVWMVQVYNRGVRTDQTFFHVFRWTNPDTDYYFSNENGVMAENLRYCHDMIAVDLGHQHIYEVTNGERTSYFLTQMPHLKYLILGNCAHDTMPELASCQELVWLELFKTSFYDLTPLLECKNLRHLNIAFIKVRGEDRRQLDVDQLKQMTWLERLWIGGNMFTARQVEELRDALPNTEIVVMYGEDATLGGWRKAEEYFKMRDAFHMYYMTDTGQTVVYNPYTGERSKYEWTNPFR